MRILVLTINYWPEQTGIGAVVTRRCEYLASMGHEVTVCTSMPYYPEWKIPAAYKGKVFFDEEHNRVRIQRSWIWVPSKVTAARRIPFEASFLASSLLRALSSSKPDLLMVVSPPLGLGLSAVLLSRWFRVPYVFDVEDLQPDAAADLGMLPKPILPFFYGLEKLAYRNARMISTVTEGMRRRIIAKDFSPNKVVVVPPPADESLFAIEPNATGEAFRAKHSLAGKFIVAHSGNMGVKQGLNLVLDAAEKLKNRKEIVFLLAGDGAMKADLQNRATAQGLENIKFLPIQAQKEFHEMLAAMDLALIIQQSSVSDIAFPSKTVTLLAAARAVVAAVSGSSEIARILTDSTGGVVVEPENPDTLTAAILDLFDNPAKRSDIAENGRKYAFQNWEDSKLLSNLEFLLRTASGEMAAQIGENAPAVSIP
jgi:colanic acid biosynthesis glycosyl transferase WcaI